RADMTGVDRRPARSEQCYERDLRPLEAKRDLEVAIWGHFLEVAVPGFARVDAQLLGRFAGNQVPGAFDVRGGERLSVMPFDAGSQFEGQLLAVLAPRPARSQIRDDRAEAVLRDMLVEHDQIVEHAHYRTESDDRRLPVKRHAGEARTQRYSEDAAGLLPQSRVACPQTRQCRA